MSALATSLMSNAASSPLADLLPEQCERLSTLLDKYLSAQEQGAPFDCEQLLADHPDLAGPMQIYFRSLEDLHALAAGCSAQRMQLANTEADFADGPRRLGDFDLLDEIGRGGMGVVYRARQLSLDRLVALKVLPFAAVLDSRQVARFQHEAQAAAQLHHPHIVPVYAIGVERGVHYYAMQLIEGQSLDRALAELRIRRASRQKRETPASLILPTGRNEYVRAVVRLGVQAAEALHAAHQSSIIHRDIKPSNLLLDLQGKLWITDFGLARFQRDDSLTRTGDRVGTLRYMSPEQAAGRTAEVDHRSDVYALGITLYELLALRAAFIEQDGPALARQIECFDPPRLHTLQPTLPSELEAVIHQAISKQRENRYSTAEEFAVDLQRVLDGKPTRARPATVVDRAARWVKRRARAVYSAAAVSLVLITGLTAASLLIGREKSRAAQSLVRADQYLSDSQQILDRFGVGLADRLATVPEARNMSRELLQETQRHFERYRADAQNNPARLADLANAYGKLALQIDKLGSVHESLAAHQATIHLLEQLVAHDDQNQIHQRQLAISQNNLGIALARIGDMSQADALYQRSIRRLERLLQRLPQDAAAREGLAKALCNRGLLLHETSRSTEAITLLTKALTLLESMPGHLATNSAATAAHRRDIALALKTLASVHSRNKQLTEAESLYRQALAIERDLLAAAPLDANLAHDLAVTENNAGLLDTRQGDFVNAEAAFSRAIELQEHLANRSPASDALHSNLAGSHSNLAVVLEKTGRPAAAAQHFSAAIKHQQLAVAAAPAVARYAQLLAAHRANQARLAVHVPASAADLAQSP